MQLADVYRNILDAGAALWAISPQEVTKNEALRQRRGLPFPLLADADLQVIHEWGLFNDKDPKQRSIPYPATYLIGRDRHALWRHVGIATRDRPTPGKIIDVVQTYVG